MLAMLADEKAARQKNLEKQDGFQGFLLCMRLKRALMKRVAKIIFYDCFFANCQKNRIWTAGYGDRHERGIKRNSKQKGSPAEIQIFGRASFCPELSVGNKSDGSILKKKVDYCVFLKQNYWQGKDINYNETWKKNGCDQHKGPLVRCQGQRTKGFNRKGKGEKWVISK